MEEADAKLGTLMSIFEDAPTSNLARVLEQAGYSVDIAVDLWLSQQEAGSGTRARQAGCKRTRDGKQLSMNSFFEFASPAVANLKKKPRLLNDPPIPNPDNPADVKPSRSLRDALRWPSSSDVPSPDMPLRKAVQPTLHLYRPEDVRLQTPCQLIYNVLPTELANGLLRVMLAESKTWRRNQWWLFERQVTSPHTTCFYVASHLGADAFQGDYYYNGAKDPDYFTMPPEVEEARRIIARIVNEEINATSGNAGWVPNVAAANCYASSKESVGYHSDKFLRLMNKLTYLGPMPIIASLSLGVERQFRIRPIIPDDNVRQYQSIYGRQISIRLPHNSLLIMKPPMQEEWKHEVPPQPTIDPHPISGTARINLTFRAYPPAYSPRFTPTCACNVPAVLRCVQRKEKNSGRYFYSCYAGGQAKGKTCGFFEWLDLEERERVCKEWLRKLREKSDKPASD